MKAYIFLLICVLGISCKSRNDKPKIYFSDVENFWIAYDSLTDTNDSIAVIQALYFDKASKGLSEFLKVRPMFTPSAYVESIRKHPKFWQSVRSRTEKIKNEVESIDKAFSKIKEIYPTFNIPEIYFLISPIGTGGTTSLDNKMLLLGAEIVMADSTVSKIEFDSPLNNIIGTINVPLYVIHESIHTAQNTENESSVLIETLMEGSAEFISCYILNKPFREKKYNFGYENECMLWNEMKLDMEKDSNFDKWFGNYYSNPHPDMGYFIGYRIIESYYNLKENKAEALIKIIELNNPNEILSESKYNGNCN
ncbi:hypothetical protein FACS1894169_06870 [Bacteroidia bacterium]|nr:hypothetical protein FACS1894169_06870 [Bacteroidia bacterium]